MKNENLLQKNFYDNYKITKILKRQKKNFNSFDENENNSDSKDVNDVYLNHYRSNSNNENINIYINNNEDFPKINQNPLTPNKNDKNRNIFETEIEVDDGYEQESFGDKINIIDNSREEMNQKIKCHKSLEVNPRYLKKKDYSKHLKKPNLFSQIQDICNHLYKDKSLENKKNVREEMFIKEGEFIKKYADQFMIPKKGKYDNNGYDILQKESSKETIQDIFKRCKSLNSVKITEANINKKKRINELIKKIFQEDDKVLNTINNKNISRYKFEHFGVKRKLPRHPCIISLKKGTSEEKMALPLITNRQAYIELSQFIPAKKNISEKRKDYCVYKRALANQREDFKI